jgi:RNA polymerase sigma-70 factor (ECF subfamily)
MCRDTNKFIELLKPNYNDAVKYCKALCSKQSADDAKDILQQSFLQALENFDSLNDETKFRSWLFTIITRVFYTSIKKNFWRRFLPLDNNERINDIPEIFSRDEVLDSRTVLNKALSKLSAKERSAILLFEIGEFSIEEIKLLQKEKSISTVKSRLSRTRKKLKKYLINTEHNSHNLKNTSNNIIGDLENETIKLASEYRSGK